MSEIADSILDAVEILVDKKTSDLQFNKTIRGKISEIIDESIGKYKIQYQNSYFTAYSSDSNATYQKGSEVYVEILSNDFEKNALILGTVRRLGSNYISIIEKLDKYTNVGAEEDYDGSIAFRSYGGTQEIELYNSENNENLWKINTENIKQAAAASDSLKLGAKIKNQLDAAQRSKQGNFGIKILVEYYNEAELDSLDERSTLIREYLFDVNDMTGQPYKYTTATNQYTIFNIDAKNFVKIKSITAFCKDFIQDSSIENPDIWIDNVNLQFLHSLTQEQLQTTSLSIETPYGNYFSTENPNDKTLKADLRIKGKKVNYDTQQVDFYWFRRNVRVNSTHEAFSAYGGNGWELLNKTSLNAYRYTLKKDLCTAAQTEFKCVAVFSDNGQVISLNSTITINNFISELKLYIDSSTGTNFAFNIGKTTLTLQGYEGTDDTRYCWTESIDGGASVFVDGNELVTNNHIDVTIATPAASLLKYECSVYEADNFIGTAAITLVNNKENLGYTLVINNGTQIFKYDSYGVSPASESFALADRMIIPALSFTIYDKLGQPIDIEEEDKTKYMNIKWIWPTGVDSANPVWKDTMLTIDKSLLKMITIPDIANGGSIQKYAICNQPILIYGIQNNYNAALANTTEANNNIRLEVEYQGEHLNASTNFTFTKEGELGTNGTKYTARIEPQDDYKEIFICGDSLYAAQYINKAESIDKVALNNLGSNGVSISSLFKVHLWNGEEDVINNATVTWGLANSTKRAGKPRLTISENNVIINQDGELYSNILQATIAYDDLKFYATYPIIYTNQLNDGKLLYIDKGYREVMYESDGTRGKFKGLPFEPKWLSSTGFTNLGTINESNWSSSWNAAAALVKDSFNKFTIEPPSYYIAEETGHYIQLTVNGITTYLPIELYLNRYGMSAMNDWDGNSIQINENGGYILSPQVGAGRKDSDNSFTGITIGEVFQDQSKDQNKKKEIGMFGYYQGQRSLFLDAETGSAEFGIEGRGRIKIDTQNNEGIIDSGDYNYSHPDGTGLKIKFTSTGKEEEKGPYIKYGSGNFEVNSQGHLVAKGGGDIAGWKISDDYLQSSDTKSTLYSGNGPEEALITDDNEIAYSDRRWSDTKKLRFNINNRFKVDEDGAIKSIAGLIGGWKIGDNTLSAKNNKLILNDNGSLYGPAASYDFTPHDRVWEITNGGVAYFTDVKIRNQPNKSGTPGGVENTFKWTGYNPKGQTTAEQYPTIFELTDTGSNIGGWSISGDKLSSSTKTPEGEELAVVLNSANVGKNDKSVLSVGKALAIYGNGDLNSSGSANFSGSGSIGGCTFGGGSFNCPAGVLKFGEVEVQLEDIKNITEVDFTVDTINAGSSDYPLEGSIKDSTGADCTLSDVKISIPKRTLKIELIVKYATIHVLKAQTDQASTNQFKHSFSNLPLNF